MKKATDHVLWGCPLLSVALALILTLTTLLSACDRIVPRSTPVIPPPAVAITSPTGEQAVQAGVDVSVNSTANDTQGVLKVELWVDGELYRVDSSLHPEGQTTFVVSQPWHAAVPGSHTMVVKAYSKSGQVAESAPVVIDVLESAATVPTDTPTTVALVPTDTPLPATDTPVLPSPTDTPVPPAPTDTPTLLPLQPTDTPLPTGTPTLPPDNPPSLQLLAPEDGVTVPQDVDLTIQVHASDDEGISRIELWADGAMYEMRDPGGTTPVEMDLTWQSSVLGDHTLEVKAFDTAWQASQTIVLRVEVISELPAVPEPFAHVWVATGGPSGRLGNQAAGAVLDRWVADQFFEGGLAYWRNNELTPADYVYVLLYKDGTDETQGTIWLQFEDLWREGMPDFSCPEAEANGALGPKRGFGKVWCEEATVRNGLGSPVKDEQGANAGFQDFENGTMLWIARLGYVYVLYSDGDWQRFSDRP